MRAALAAFAALPLCAAALTAQTAGTIYGTVRDSAGRPVDHGTVQIVGAAGPGAAVGWDGRFRLPGVPAGDALVRVTALGYLPADRRVVVVAGDSARLDVTLARAAVALAPVVVTAGKRPQSLEQVVASVAVVSDSDIAKRAVNTVDEAVDKAPGVQFLNGQINIRGSTGYVQGVGARVLMLVDGVPANEGDRGGIDWDLVPVDQVDRVEVVKGAGSALYGSAALGGVVNVITRDPAAGLHARLRVTGGAFANPPDTAWRFRDFTGGAGGADLTASYGMPGAAGSVFAGGRHSDGYRQQDRDDEWHAGGKAVWLPDPLTRVEISGAWSSHRYQVPLVWCVRGRCDDRGLAFQPFMVDTGDAGAHTRSDKGYLAATLTRRESAALTWYGRVSWIRTHFTDFQPSGNDFAVANRVGIEGRAVATPAAGQTVTMGVEGAASSVTSDIFAVHSQGEFAAYGESERRLGPARLTAGARVDFLTVDGGALSAEVSPRVGAVLVTSAGIVRASLGRGFRAPTLAERFVRTVVPPFTVRPNPDLGPETSWTGELGDAADLPGGVHVDAALFWTEARGLIEPAVDPATISIQFQNVARARLAGLDLAAEAHPFTPALALGLAYTYLDARELAHDTVPERPLAFRPRHLVTLSGDYGWRAWSVGADFRYMSRFDRVDLYPADPRLPVKVLDLRAGWGAGPVAVRVLVANALNYIYNLVPRTLAPVRTVTATLTYAY